MVAMRLACETVVRDVLPAIRSLVARELHAKGYTQTEIADLLDLTQPAVSQYINASRGTRMQQLEQDDRVAAQITELVEAVVSGAHDDELSEQLCDICTDIQDRNLINTDSRQNVCLHDR